MVCLNVDIICVANASGIGMLLQQLAAGCGTGIGLQHMNDDQSAKCDKPGRWV